MDIVYDRCCGLDIHKKTIVACTITPEGKEVKSYGTLTENLLELADWILAKNCSAVAMESTGVYWKPIYNLLEGLEIEVMVVNAKHIKTVPGRKTDVKDSEWIASLLKHGLVKGSYIPDREQRELRELVRYRKSLIGERSRAINRIQKVLEGANIKLGSVISNIIGVSGRRILEALAKGIDDPDVLNNLANKQVKSKGDSLKKSLKGLLGNHQRQMISTGLQHIDFLSNQIDSLSKEIGDRMRPFEEALELVDSIPGIGRRTAEEVIAETGIDMSRWPTAQHLVSWAGLAPGDNESAGKKKSTKTRPGNSHIKSALVEASRSAVRKNGTYLKDKYARISARRGGNRAAVAIAREMLVMLYHMLNTKTPYIERGAEYYRQKTLDRQVRQNVRKLEALGYKVVLEETA